MTGVTLLGEFGPERDLLSRHGFRPLGPVMAVRDVLAEVGEQDDQVTWLPSEDRVARLPRCRRQVTMTGDRDERRDAHEMAPRHLFATAVSGGRLPHGFRHQLSSRTIAAMSSIGRLIRARSSSGSPDRQSGQPSPTGRTPR